MTKLENIIISVLVIIMILFIIIFMVLSEKENSERRDEICNKIAKSLGLNLLQATRGNCGWGEECDFQCRLLNSKGEIVIRNYP